jgi:hypothetical protein
MVCIPGQTATNTKDSGRCASSMDKELTLSFLGMSTLESTTMASHKEEESTPGQMDRSTLENSEKA